MDLTLESLLFSELIWVPWVILFLAGNLVWKADDSSTKNVILYKEKKIFKEKPKKSALIFFFGFALVWLIFAIFWKYPPDFPFWVLFFANQILWIATRVKYYEYLKKYLVILERPRISKKKRGAICIGKIDYPSLIPKNFFLNLNDLRKHLFVCGLTGMGKSNFIRFFLKNFYEKYPNIPFFIVEFKGEYKTLQNPIPDIHYLHPGETFSINIFDPVNSDPNIHAERLFDILRSCQIIEESNEFSPQMEKVLVDILKEVCKNPQKQTFQAFSEEIEKYRIEYRNQIPLLDQTIISITNRLRRLFSGPLKPIFEKTGGLTVKEILSQRVCLDMSSIIRLGGEKRDAVFFLNMVFKYLWDQNLSTGATDSPRHMTLLEDAQYFIPYSLIKQSKLTSYIEDVALLQRGTGEILVSIATRPAVSEDVLANAGTFLTFQTHYDTAQIQELTGLKDEQMKILGALQEGDCIIRVASIPHPFKLKIPLFKSTSEKLVKVEETPLLEATNVDTLAKPRKLFIAYFHNIRGPQFLPFSNNILEKQESQRILTYMEQNNGLIDIQFDANQYLLSVFEVPSKWARGKVELMMIGIKLELNQKDENKINEIKSKISEFIVKGQNDDNFFKTCYIERIQEDEYSAYCDEIKAEYSVLVNDVSRMELDLISGKVNAKIKKKVENIANNLNPSQLEALRDLNDYIEELLRKEN